MNLAKVTSKLKAQIQIFSGKLSHSLPKVSRRFIEEMVYGIQSKQSVKLSEIARALNENIPLIKTINRLSRQLSREELWEKLTAGVLDLSKGIVKERTLLVIDISDISKSYAKQMEHLGRVRDGSRDEIREGYWTCQVIACEAGESEIIPLYHDLYSSAAPDFTSETEELKKAINMVSYSIDRQNQGVWVIDRGGDRRQLYDHLLTDNKHFIIRLKGDRHLIYKGDKVIASNLADRCFCPFTGIVVREKQAEEKVYHISYGFCRVGLPDIPRPLFLLVVRGFGDKPMMLLTDLPMRKNRNVLWKVVESYITRWRVEDTIRFIKQSYNLEDIRLLTYRRLQNMMALVLAAAYFASAYIGRMLKFRVFASILTQMAKRIFGIPDFRYYAIADGIKELLSKNIKGPLRSIPTWIPKTQLSLFAP
jgi:hypothetical protein